LGFDPERLKRASAKALMKKRNVVRNARKINSIIHNARSFSRIAGEHGSFAKFVELLEVASPGDAVKTLRRNFRYVGSYTAEFYLRSIGFKHK
jgi:3-methyladenine DNA glycosylase Tag